MPNATKIQPTPRKSTIFELKRTYYHNGTNGEIFQNGRLICYSIELPYKSNQKNISCIPEGLYTVKPYMSSKFGDVYIVENVQNRAGILLHPANNALKELQGCIAPVTELNGNGLGLGSRKALKKLFSLFKIIISKNKNIHLLINTKQPRNETH